MEKTRELQKNFCFIDYAKAFDCVDHNKVENSLRDGSTGLPYNCLVRNLYAGQEEIVRIGHETMDWFKIGKGVQQSCMLSPSLFNLYAEYIMWNARLDDSQAGIKIAWRNSLRYADDTALMTESEEELRSLLMSVKEGSQKAGLKLNIKKNKIMASLSLHGK